MDKLVRESLGYARGHLQAVRIVWVDRAPQVVGAVGAVELLRVLVYIDERAKA